MDRACQKEKGAVPTLAGLQRRLKPGNLPSGLPPAILMTDGARLPDPEPWVAGLPRGAAVILRDYQAANRLSSARHVVAVCHRRQVRVLIAGDARLAVASGADGLHLPEAMARRARRFWRRWRRPGWLVTAAAHSPRALRRAVDAGADAVLLSPVFATISHPLSPPLGPLRFAALVAASPLPVYALGGITRETLARLSGSGACGFAGIGVFLCRPRTDPLFSGSRGSRTSR
jgi:thiamine-phosphate pyrophosphorylase